MRGSSPHTRGALALTNLAKRTGRIIPAYAGSTRWRWMAPTRSEDHPRIRGEHRALNPGGVFSAGSSPHTRGARALRATETGPLRIIPAYAGSTLIPLTWQGYVSDHPRIRGEHVASATPEACPEGSSPHTRGAPSRDSGS